MAGKIIADTIEASGSQISLNVGNTTILTASSTGLTLIPTTNVNVNLTNSIVTLTNGSATSPGLTFSGNTRTGLFMPSANTLAFTAANTESMRIDSSGNVGIGTNLPSYALDIRSSSLSGALGVNLTSGTTLTTAQGSTTNVDMAFVTKGAGLYTWTQGSTERMRIDSSGNVGIGTTNPLGLYNAALAVVSPNTFGTVTVKCTSTTGAAGLSVQNDAGTSDVFLYSFNSASGSTNTGIGTSKNNPVLFYQNNGERMRIDSSGNLLIGTGGGSLPNGTSVYGSAFDDNGGNTKRLRLASSVTTTMQLVSFYNPNGNVGNITTTASATAYATSSDYRLKNTIAPMTGALAKVQALKPVSYKWNADNSDGQGFIAHELAEVVPQCVIGEKDAVDAEGNPVYQGIDTSFLVATLTAAIQELKAIVDAQAAEIAALKAK